MEVVREHERHKDVAERAQAIPQAGDDPRFGRLYLEQTSLVEAWSSCHQQRGVTEG